MSDGDIEFPEAPLSPSLPIDFLEPRDPPSPDAKGSGQPSGAARKRLESRRDARQKPDARASEEPSTNASREPSREPNREPNREPSHDAKRLEQLDTSPQKARFASDEPGKELNSLMVKWIARARAKKHESDHASKDRKHRLAAVLALDAVVCFMIGFDYENRSEAARTGSSGASGPAQPRSWGTLVPYLAKLASAVESVDADLAGVYYQVCAVVRLHVVYMKRKSVPPDESASGLYAALSDFRRGLALLPLHIIHNRYGLDEQHGWIQAKLNPDKPDPLSNCAALPLHVNSSLAEAAAFALNIGRKWAQLEGIDYTWDAARS